MASLAITKQTILHVVNTTRDVTFHCLMLNLYVSI